MAKAFTMSGLSWALSLTLTLMEMIAVENQPFSIVEDVGFCTFVAKLEPN